MKTEAETFFDVEAVFEEELPCDQCGKGALVRSKGHSCPVRPGPFYKCLPCWQKWLSITLGKMANHGGWICCTHRQRHFNSVEEFSDYRPF